MPIKKGYVGGDTTIPRMGHALVGLDLERKAVNIECHVANIEKRVKYALETILNINKMVVALRGHRNGFHYIAGGK